MDNLSNILESIIFLSGRAVEIKDISDKLSVPAGDILEAAKQLQERYSGECGIHLLVFNGKLQFCSNPDYARFVEDVLQPIKERELSKAMLEVASIIAYRQPVTRLEIEELRGVNSDYSISVLSKFNLIKVVGRKDAIGKPLLFGTTDEFLKRFQLSDLGELPDYDTLMERIKILHSPVSSDLFYKEEYKEEDEENPPTETQIEDGEGTPSAQSPFELQVPADRNDEETEAADTGADDAEKPDSEVFAQGAEEAASAVEADATEADAREENGEEGIANAYDESLLDEEIPDFLAGESGIKRIQ